MICAGGTPNCSNTTASGQYGIMISGNAAAYPTTAGYDLATGLGSVNVANLVNNWKSNFTHDHHNPYASHHRTRHVPSR